MFREKVIDHPSRNAAAGGSEQPIAGASNQKTVKGLGRTDGFGLLRCAKQTGVDPKRNFANVGFQIPDLK